MTLFKDVDYSSPMGNASTRETTRNSSASIPAILQDRPIRRPSNLEFVLTPSSQSLTQSSSASDETLQSTPDKRIFSDHAIPELPTPYVERAAFLSNADVSTDSDTDDSNVTTPAIATPTLESNMSLPQPAKTRRSSWYNRRVSMPALQMPAGVKLHRGSVFAPDDGAAGVAMSADAPAVAPPLARRASMWENRRNSQFWQAAIGDEEKPGYIRRGSMYIRNASTSSLKGFNSWTGAPARRISVFEEDLDLHRQDIIEFIATVKTKNEKDAAKLPWLKRSRVFPPLYILSIALFIYFVFVGRPVWNGLAYEFWVYFNTKSHFAIGTAVWMSWAAFQSFLPIIFCRFEQEVDLIEDRDASEVALIIPAYKAAGLLGPTIEHALKIFTKSQIFIIANGNSKEPLDNAAEVCEKYGVNHYWVPIGSKITAEFVGVAVASKYKYVMLIDDDVHLPANLPMVTKRINDVTKCIGYTIKSTGADGIKGTYIQQCQDMEYKSSGLTRTWCGRWGSANFPHGAIILWEREALQSLFTSHPGYIISEDWYFGHVARQAGMRIEFCSQVFVETETPPCLLWDSVGGRGGYGEMTVWKQRFYRWNYFFLFRVYDDLLYIFFNWRLGFREITAKYAALIEVVDSLMNLFRPFIFVLSLILSWRLTLTYIAALMGMYLLAFIVFNEWQLRLKNERVSLKIIPHYFFMKFVLLWFGTASMYYGIYSYIAYFSKRHPKVIENHEALEAAYNIRCGVKLVPLADTVSEVIEQVEEVQQTREDDAEIVQLHEVTPSSSVEDLEKGADGHETVVTGGMFSGFTMRQ